MRTYSLNELFRLTRNELFEFHSQIVTELPFLLEDEQVTAHEVLRRIRHLLSLPRYGP